MSDTARDARTQTQQPSDLDEENARLERSTPEEILGWATQRFAPDVIITCSFQHDGGVLAHMLTSIAPWVPVVFLNTGFHCPETIAYRDEIVARFGLNLREIGPS